MPYTQDQNHFFPPALKWISLGFFALILASIAYVTFTTPESYNAAMQTLSAQDDEPLPTIEQTPSSTPSSTTSPSQITPTPSETKPSQSVTPTEEPNTRTEDSTLDQQSVQEPEPTVAAYRTNTQNKCAEPDIKGIIWKNKKYYYSKGMQDYHVIDMLRDIKVARWFCSKEQAESEGWHKANPLLYEIIKSALKLGKNLER